MPPRKRARQQDSGSERNSATARPPQSLEQPPHPIYRSHFYCMTQIPDNPLRPGKTGAYDDLVFKRRKLNSQGKQVEAKLGSPWEDDNNLEKPPRPEALFEAYERLNPRPPEANEMHGGDDTNGEIDPNAQRNGTGERQLNRTENEKIPATVANLPLEIREIIFRYLLLSPREIQVLRQWTLVYNRQKLKLHPHVLAVCRQWKHEGLNILYGENTFCYKIRDPKDGSKGVAIVYERVYRKNTVPFKKYRHLMRRVKVQLEANRMHFHGIKSTFETALAKLLPGDSSLAKGVGIDGPGPRLFTLTIEVPALTLGDFQRAFPILPLPSQGNYVPIYDFLTDGNILPLLTALHVRSIRVLANAGNRGCFEGILPVHSNFRLKDLENSQSESAGSLEGPEGLERMELERKASRERAGLHLLPYKLQLLAFLPDQGDYSPMVYRHNFWKPAQDEVYEESLHALSENGPPSVAQASYSLLHPWDTPSIPSSSSSSSSPSSGSGNDDPPPSPRRSTKERVPKKPIKKQIREPDPSPPSSSSSDSDRCDPSPAPNMPPRRCINKRARVPVASPSSTSASDLDDNDPFPNPVSDARVSINKRPHEPVALLSSSGSATRSPSHCPWPAGEKEGFDSTQVSDALQTSSQPPIPSKDLSTMSASSSRRGDGGNKERDNNISINNTNNDNDPVSGSENRQASRINNDVTPSTPIIPSNNIDDNRNNHEHGPRLNKDAAPSGSIIIPDNENDDNGGDDADDDGYPRPPPARLPFLPEFRSEGSGASLGDLEFPDDYDHGFNASYSMIMESQTTTQSSQQKVQEWMAS